MFSIFPPLPLCLQIESADFAGTFSLVWCTHSIEFIDSFLYPEKSENFVDISIARKSINI
jgi:hypothetical protein